MNIHVINPLSDERWDQFVAGHPRASAFHQKGWLQALACTYGYEPFVITSASPGEVLRDGLPLCCVSSWITGNRLVSLPFADHCEPLLTDGSTSLEFMGCLRAERDQRQYAYVELRPFAAVADSCPGLVPNRFFYCHRLDLSPSLESIFQRLHKDSVQRKIQRAEREKLSEVVGQSQELIDTFCQLLLMTRRRHQLPPQPRSWFDNLVACMGDKIQIRLARKHDRPIAAILTLRHRSSVVYKYGCSDARFDNLGGMPLLLWRLIQESKASGVEEIDFGWCDIENEGLSTFKDRFNAQKGILTYYRYPNVAPSADERNSQVLRRLFSLLPDAALRAAGNILYRHMG